MNSSGRVATREGLDGLIGWVRGDTEGPLLLCVGGLHGNEPAGVAGLEELVAEIEARSHLVRGDFVAVAGNLQALAAGRRFMSYDLNRAWTASPDRRGPRPDPVRERQADGVGGPGAGPHSGRPRRGGVKPERPRLVPGPPHHLGWGRCIHHVGRRAASQALRLVDPSPPGPGSQPSTSRGP